MSATKSWLMDIEEKAWDDVADIIGECEHISEAVARAGAIFSQAGLIGYLSVDDIDEGVGEMWNEKWSQYA
tara:strand:+ start:530 stop:742 length:213 start_codon:yes stop_codon:yes gene_type:complete